jgi:hypothetical protein
LLALPATATPWTAACSRVVAVSHHLGPPHLLSSPSRFETCVFAPADPHFAFQRAGVRAAQRRALLRLLRAAAARADAFLQ